MLVTTELAIAHCNADEADAELIAFYLAAAEQEASDFINRKIYATQVELDAAVEAGTAGVAPIVVTAAIRVAILLIVGHRFANREDVVIGTISSPLPNGSRSSLQPYRYGMGA